MILNLLYISILSILSPWLLLRALRTGRYRRDLAAKLIGRVQLKSSSQFTVWFHGVSVGEIHLLVTLIDAYRKRHPDHRIIISSTTDTGLAEARKKFENVVAWPFDFTWAVARALDAVQPDLIVLAEGEMWPNFLRAAQSRSIPVAVINARLSPRSYRRYSRVAGLARHFLFNHVSVLAVQDNQYAERFRQLGVPTAKLVITGSIKYDGALRDRTISKLSQLLPKQNSMIWVAGSTHTPEESIVLDAFAKLRMTFPDLRLILVPRHPDRFEEVTRLLETLKLPFLRRSRIVTPLDELPPILLLDTIGELGAAWCLADIGYVGGTLCVHRGGQSMIEPAGYGVPTLFGPHVWNFADAARRLVESGGAIMVPNAEALVDSLASLLQDVARRSLMGANARKLVASQQGATERTLDMLSALSNTFRNRRAA